MADISKAVSLDECPPTLFATLLPQSALESFEKAWSEPERAARSPVRQRSTDAPLRIVAPRSDDVDARALSRWEDDGGYVPTMQRIAP